MEEPASDLSNAVSKIRSASSDEQRSRLLSALVTLLRTEEAIVIVEKLIESDDVLLDTPYLRRLRQQGREEGRAMGRMEGLRETLLAATVQRFNPLAVDYRRLEQQIEPVTDAAVLQSLLLALLEIEDIATYLAHVEQTVLKSLSSEQETVHDK